MIDAALTAPLYYFGIASAEYPEARETFAEWKTVLSGVSGEVIREELNVIPLG